MKPLKIFMSVIVLFTCITLNANYVKNDTTVWSCVKSELIAVYINDKINNRKEVLRLFKDNTYEYMVYTNTNKKITLVRDCNTYTLNGKRLVLNKPKSSAVNSSYYKQNYYVNGDGNLEEKIIQCLTGKSPILKKDKIFKYNLPYYLDPDSKTIIYTKDADKKININELVIQLVSHCTSEREKANVIIEFIIVSVEYDHIGMKYNKFSNKQGDINAIIAGKNRVAVCAGYSNVLNKLCEIADIKCREISGSARNSITDINKSVAINHAWNIVTIDGSDELYDITWADCIGSTVWLNVNPKIMIYTHFPDKKEDQLLDITFSKIKFDNSPIVKPKGTGNLLFFSQTDGYVFADSIFKMEFVGSINNIEVWLTNGNVFSTVYTTEAGATSVATGYVRVKYKKTFENGKTFVEIPLIDMISGVWICLDDFEISYIVIMGDRSDLYRHYQHKSDKLQIDAYLRAILASVYLNDVLKLEQLVGVGNSLFFDKKGKIKHDNGAVDDFRNWDGKLSTWICYSEIKYGKTKIITNKIIVGNYVFTFIKKTDGYEIISIK